MQLKKKNGKFTACDINGRLNGENNDVFIQIVHLALHVMRILHIVLHLLATPPIKFCHIT